jgi:hypothetical protein
MYDIGWEFRRKWTSMKTKTQWVDNFKMDLGEIARGGMDKVMNLQVP